MSQQNYNPTNAHEYNLSDVRRCSHCGKVKELNKENFYRRTPPEDKKDNIKYCFTYVCIECKRGGLDKKDYQTNKQIRLAKTREWQNKEENKGKIKEYKKLWAKKHRQNNEK